MEVIRVTAEVLDRNNLIDTSSLIKLNNGVYLDINSEDNNLVVLLSSIVKHHLSAEDCLDNYSAMCRKFPLPEEELTTMNVHIDSIETPRSPYIDLYNPTPQCVLDFLNSILLTKGGK